MAPSKLNVVIEFSLSVVTVGRSLRPRQKLINSSVAVFTFKYKGNVLAVNRHFHSNLTFRGRSEHTFVYRTLHFIHHFTNGPNKLECYS